MVLSSVPPPFKAPRPSTHSPPSSCNVPPRHLSHTLLCGKTNSPIYNIILWQLIQALLFNPLFMSSLTSPDKSPECHGKRLIFWILLPSWKPRFSVSDNRHIDEILLNHLKPLAKEFRWKKSYEPEFRLDIISVSLKSSWAWAVFIPDTDINCCPCDKVSLFQGFTLAKYYYEERNE